MIYAIDFEFNKPQNADIGIVSVAVYSKAFKRNIWLDGDPAATDRFKAWLKAREGCTFLAYAAMAEARCFRSLGIDPTKYKWIDLFIESRMLQNWNLHWMNKNPSGRLSLVATAKMFDINLDGQHKDEMRDLIISAGPFNEEDKKSILEYGESDVEHLEFILNKFIKYYSKRGKDELRNMVDRGKYIAALSLCEHLGLPLDVQRIRKINDNYDEIRDKAIMEMNNVFEIWKKTKKGAWVKKTDQFNKMVESLGNASKTWPRTSRGAFSQESAVISANRHYPQIEAFYQTIKLLNSIKHMSPKNAKSIWSVIGQDNRCRFAQRPFTSQTGRNQPKGSQCPLLMSNWLRCIIRPAKGKLITGIDFGSQEFLVGAALSDDENMLDAYNSGDPYLYFAKAAGAVPQDGLKADYKKERDLFKGTTLGLQYGMGANKLSDKLKSDFGMDVSPRDATKLINLHKNVFPKYWSFLDHIGYTMDVEGYLELSDGWKLFQGNGNFLSTRNFPIQGTSAAILRLSIIKAVAAGLQVLTPLHDAIYIEHSEDDKDAVQTLMRCMQDATVEVCGKEIRMDVESHGHEDEWVESKGQREYDIMREYI